MSNDYLWIHAENPRNVYSFKTFAAYGNQTLFINIVRKNLFAFIVVLRLITINLRVNEKAAKAIYFWICQVNKYIQWCNTLCFVNE